MNVSIDEKKAFGGAALCYKQLEDYRRCRGMKGGIIASLKTWRSLAGSCWMIKT